MRRLCLFSLALLTLSTGPGSSHAGEKRAHPQTRTSSRLSVSWPSLEARGLTSITGHLHVHSPYSHDACNYDPMTPEGTPKPECVQRIRDAICTVPRAFFMLTDHSSHMSEQVFEDLFLYDPAQGDELIIDAEGNIEANQILCSNGTKTWNTWLSVGLEGSHNMPVGLEAHLDNPGLYGVGFGIDEEYFDQADEIDDIHRQNGLALVAHMEEEDVTTGRLGSLDIDGIELYNAHSNINVILNQHVFQLLWLEPWLAGSENPPESDYVALLMYPYMNLEPITKWDELNRLRATSGVIGTDVHENVTLDPYCLMPELQRTCTRLARHFPNFIDYLTKGGPIPMGDGERLDSYVRMFRWFSNHLRGSIQAPRDVKTAIKSGNNFVTFDILGMPEDFDFIATADGTHFTEMGQTMAYSPGTQLHITLPKLSTTDVRGDTWTQDELAKAEIRGVLLQVDDNTTQTVAELKAGTETLDYTVTTPGAYRLEVYIRPHHLTKVLGGQPQYAREEYLWIWSNPIYIR